MNLKMGGINNEPSKEDLKDKVHSETMVSWCRVRSIRTADSPIP